MALFKKIKKSDEQTNKPLNEGINNNSNNKEDSALKLNDKKEIKSVLAPGSRKPKDFIAPPSIDRSREDCLKIGNKYCRSFIVNGFPSIVQVGWLDDLFNSEGDMDTAIYVQPADDREALDELTAKITQFEAQLDIEMKRGNIRNITKLQATIEQLYDQRRKLEQNYENFFYIHIVSNLYENSLESLDKQTQKLTNRLKGRKIDLSPMYLRQEDAYKSGLPFGVNFIKDKMRNFNSGALTACFPFYNSEVSHKNGVFIGINLSTMTPVLIDFYDRSILNNSNASVFGQAGSGKTFFVSLLTLRSALKGVRTVIIDPEGEYRKLTQALGGAYIKLSPESKTYINPFDIEEELDPDEGVRKVDIRTKVSDLLNLIVVMVGGVDSEQRSIVSSILTDLYNKDFGITEDPESLYEDDLLFDDERDELGYRVRKTMPTLSDLHAKLEAYAQEANNENIMRLANTLKMFVKGGIYDLFDHQTSPELREFSNAPIVSFDVSQLEEGTLRPIGMYVALSWTWEKFVKKNRHIKKRIVCDEAWMLVNKNMAGSAYTATFLENCARRIRKRNGGLLVASQNFVEFADNPQGKAVLTNTICNIFLRQNSTDIDAVQETFKLSEGEKIFLSTAKRGEMLIKMNEESSVAFALAFPYEAELITNAYVKKD
jgi:type IV secretory pathway VirB4 component